MTEKAMKSKLRKTIKGLAPSTISKLEPIIEDAAFLAEQLDEMRAFLRENGWIEGYTNGANQVGLTVSSMAKAYFQAQKSFNADIKTILAVLESERSTGHVLPAARNGLLALLKKEA